MRRFTTSLVVVAVAGIALAAVIDSVLTKAEPAGAPTTKVTVEELEQPNDAAAELAGAGVTGTLLLRSSRCAVRELALPSLAERHRSQRLCSLPDAVPSGEGSFERELRTARCRSGTVEVASGGDVVARFRGCEPRDSDGVLTPFRGEERDAASCGPAAGAARPRSGAVCSRVLLSRADLRRSLADAPGTHMRVVGVAWLGDRMLAVVIRVDRAGRTGDYLALFRGRGLVGSPFGIFPRLGALRASPDGRYVAAAKLGYQPSVVIVSRTGAWVREIAAATAVAWSPDGRWVAVAHADRLAILDRATSGDELHVSVPLPTVEVVWR